MPQVTAPTPALNKVPADDTEFKALLEALEARAAAKNGSDAGDELLALCNLVKYLAADAGAVTFP